jgi:hypothetical protein
MVYYRIYALKKNTPRTTEDVRIIADQANVYSQLAPT